MWILLLIGSILILIGYLMGKSRNKFLVDIRYFIIFSGVFIMMIGLGRLLRG